MTNEQKTFCASCGNELQVLNTSNPGVCSNCKIHYVVHNGTIMFGKSEFIFELYNTYFKQPPHQGYPLQGSPVPGYGYPPPTNYSNPYMYYYHKPEYKKIIEPDNTQHISSILSRLITLENEMKDLKNKK